MQACMGEVGSDLCGTKCSKLVCSFTVALLLLLLVLVVRVSEE